MRCEVTIDELVSRALAEHIGTGDGDAEIQTDRALDGDLDGFVREYLLQSAK